MTTTELQPPGAGLPPSEHFIIRNLAFPWLRFRLTRERSLAVFEQSGQTILKGVEALDYDQLTQRVLIKRLTGMEDSSRNWSAELTLEHIQVVTAAALYIIDKLENQRPLDLPVRTQDVKPTGGLGLDRVRAFRDHVAEVPVRIAEYDFQSQATHEHPWFGDLRSIDWLRLIAFHQDLHRKQIARILRDFS